MDPRALVLLAFVAGIAAGPINSRSEQCALTCTESSKLNYEPGRSYEFSYEADTVTTLKGTSQEHSSLHIRATADVSVMAPCEHALTLRNVQLEVSDPTDLSVRMPSGNQALFQEELEMRPLRFSFQDGRVEELCASGEEPQWVLNIKRGVLSAFQNSMEHLESDHTVTESDVSGNCEAEYQITGKSRNSVTVKKSKNLLACTDRADQMTAFQTTPYRVPSAVQSLPLLSSTHECEQTLQTGGALQRSECHETHVFRPFSGSDNGATTTSHHLLKYVRESGKSPRLNGDWNRRTSLVFEHKPTDSSAQRGMDQAQDSLRQICDAQDIRPETPRLFSDLVHRLRDLDADTLRDLQKAVAGERVCRNNHQLAKKFFHDAIPMVGSAGAVGLIRDLVVKGRVSGVEADAWLTSLAFISQPDGDMMREVKPLLDMPQPRRSLLLSVSSLVNSYCQTASDCDTNMHVQDMATRLTENLGHHCKALTPAEQEQVMMSLKALGNMGVASSSVGVLNRCLADQENPAEVRLSAMNAFRRMDCKHSREELLRLFENAEEDSELRIGAYLGAMQCPGNDVITRVRSVLAGEEVNQVGSFVWTHLTNLAETADPFRQDIRDILRDTELSKTFDMDKRKFSRNYEGSMFFPSVNMGGKAESNLVWSSNSYIPRSANLNLTVDLFGQSVNLLEVGGRVEGLEALMESLFGPNGYFPENTVSKALKRQRRAASEKLSSIHQRFNAKGEDSPRGSGYIRMFGNELGFQEFEGVSLQGAKDKFNFVEMLLKLAKDNRLEFTKSVHFLDSTLSVPTVAGLPLRLALDGSASVDVLVTGKVDLRQAATAPRSLNIDGTVRPSGAVEITSMMTVDAFVSSSGLKMVTSLHSSTELKGQVQLQDSEVITASLDMARDKQEILDVQSKFFIVHRDEEREQAVAAQVERSWCSGRQVETALGVQLCAEIQYPRASETSPSFPLSGPAGFTVTLHKKDTHSAYEFEGRLQTRKERVSSGTSLTHVGKLSFNTPGSSVDRQFLVDLTLDQGRKTIDATFRSPWKKVVTSGEITYDETAKRLSARATIDDRKQYSLTSDLQVTKVKGTYTISPSVEVSIHGWDVMSLNGLVKYNPEEIVDVDLTMNNVLKRPVTLKAIMEKEEDKKQTRYTANLKLGSHLLNVGYKGFLEDRGNVMRTRMTFTHDFRADKPYTYTLVANGKQVDNKKLFKYSVHADFDNDQFPGLNMLTDASMSSKDGHVDGSLDVRYGGNLKDESRRLTLNTEANWEGPLKAFQADHSLDISIPALNIDMTSKINHRHSPSDIKTQAMVRYQRGKKLNFDLNLRRESMEPMLMGADISLSYPGRILSLSERLEETQPNTYNHELTLKWRKNAEFRTVGVYKMGPGNKHDLSAEIYPPGQSASTLTASATLLPDDFEAKVKVGHRREIYSTAVIYNYNLPKEVHGSVELEVPSRHITAGVDLTKQGNEYTGHLETRWDVEHDAGKKVILDGRFEAEPNKNEGHMKLVIPKRKLSASFTQEKSGNDFSSSAEVSWAPKKSISVSTMLTYVKQRTETEGRGRVVLTTPFNNFEELKLDGEFNSNRRKHAGNAAFTWSEGQTIRTTVATTYKSADWTSVDNSITVDTPFQRFKRMVGIFNYNLEGNQAESHIEANWDDEKVEMDVSGRHELDSNRRNIEGSVEVKTTFRSMKNMGVHLSHSLDDTQMLSKMEGNWKNKKMSVELKGQNTGSGRNRKLEGTISLKTPFEMVPEASLSVTHRDDKHQYISSLETSWSRNDRIQMSLDLINEGIGWHINNHGRAQITTPFNGFREVSASWLQLLQDGTIKSTNEIELNGKRYQLNAEGNHQTYAGRQLDGKFSLQTPHTHFENIEFTGEYNRNLEGITSRVVFSKDDREHFFMSTTMRKDGDVDYDGKVEVRLLDQAPVTANVFLKASQQPHTGHAEITWAKNKRVSLDGELTVEGMDLLKGNLRLATPVNGPYERIVLNVDHANMAGEWRSHADFEYNGGKADMDTVFAFGDTKKVNIAIHSPSAYLRSFNLDLEHAGTNRRFQNKIDMNYKGQGSKVTFDSALIYNGIKDISGQVTFTSPFQNAKNLELNLRNKRKGNGEWISTADFQYQPQQKIELETRMMNSDTVSASLNLATPFRSLKKLSTGFEHVGTSSTYDNKVSFSSVSNGKKRQMSTSLIVRGLGNVNGQLMYSCPHHDISLNVNHVFDGKNLNNRADIMVDEKKMSWEASLQTQDDIKAEFNLQTPFEAMSSLTASVGHSGEMPACSSRGSFNIVINGQATSLDGDLQIAGLSFLDGHLTLTSPYQYFEKLEITGNHRKAQNLWTTSGTVSYAENKAISLSSKLNVKNPALTLVFKSPFQDLEKIVFSGSHENIQGTLTTHAELKLQPNQKYSIDTKIVASREPKLNVEIRTPLDSLKHFIINFEHTGQPTDFQTAIEIDYEPLSSKIQTELTFKTQRGNAEANLSVNSPFFDAIKTSISHRNMGGKVFDTKAIVDYGQTIELNSHLNLRNLGEPDGEITFTSPFPIARNLKLSFNHNGSPRSFTSHVEGRYNMHKATMDASFNAMSDIRGNFKLETTHKALEMVELLFNHEGEWNSFQNHAEFTYGNGERIQLDSSLNLKAGVEGQLEIKTPFYNPVSLTIRHQGELADFQHTSSVQYGRGQRFSLNGNFQAGRVIDGEFTLDTPFDFAKNILVHINHRGPLKNFQCSGRIVFNGKEAEGKLSADTRGPIAAKMQFRSPMEHFEDISMNFDLSGDLPQFNTKMEINYAPSKSILVEGALNINSNIEARFHLNTPCPYVKDILFNFGHEGTKSNFRTNANLSYNSGRIFEFNGEFNAERNIEGSASLKTPIKSMELNFFHRGNLRSLTNQAVLKYEDSLFQTDFSLKTDPKLENLISTFRLQTPFRRIRDVNANVNYEDDGKTRKFSTEFSSDFIKTIRFNGDLQVSPKVSGNFHLETPFEHINDVVLNINYKGNARRFKTSLEFSSDDFKDIQFESDFKTTTEITGSFSLRTPFKYAKRVSASLSHTGSFEDFQCHGEFFHNLVGNIQGDITFHISPQIEGRFSIQTPMNYAKETSLRFTHSGGVKKFQNLLEFSNNYLGLFEYDGEFTRYPETSGNFRLKTPVTHLKDLTLNFNHQGSLTAFTSHVEANSIELGKSSIDANFRAAPNPSGSLTVETPIPGKEKIHLNFKHNGNWKNFRSEAELRCFSGNTIKANGNLRLHPSIEGAFNLQTPFRKLEDISFSAKHDGSLKEFSTQAQLHSGQKSLITLETEFKTTPSVDGVFKLQSSCPVVRDIFFHFNHDGELKDFKTLVEATLNREKTIRGTAEFKTSPTIQGSAKLETPFPRLRDMEASFNHRGSLWKFQSDGQFNFNGRPMVTYDAKFRPVQSYLKMRTPITNFKTVGIAYNHRGDLNAFQTHAEAEVNNQKIEGDVEFSLPLSGKLTVRTPFKKLQEQSVAFSHGYSPEGFQTHGEVNFYKGQASVDADVKYSPLELKVQMSSPYQQVRDLTVSLNHKMNKKILKSNGEIHLNGEMQFAMDVDLKNYARKSGTIQIKTPFSEDMSLGFRHSGDASGFKSKGDFSYAPGKTLSADLDINVSPTPARQIAIKTPFRGFEDVSVDFSHEQNPNAIKSMGRVTYGGQQIQANANLARTRRSIDGTVQLSTPFRYMEELGAEVHHEGDLTNMQGSAAVKYGPGKTIHMDGSYKPTQLILNLRTPFEHAQELNLDLSGSHEAPRGSFSWAPNKKITLDGSLKHSGGWWEKVLEGNLEMRTPFQQFHHMSLSGQHQHSSSNVRSTMKAGFNNKDIFDIDVNYNGDSNKNGAVILRLPRSARAEFDMNKNGGSASINWDASRDDSNIRIEVSTNDEGTRYRTKRDITVKSITPTRTMAFSTSFDKSTKSLDHRSEFSWDERSNKKVSYEVTFKDNSRRSKNVYELSGRIDTPIRSLALEASHSDDSTTYITDMSALWDAARDLDRKLSLKNVYHTNGNQHNNELTISHPRMSKDIVVRNEVILNDNNVLYSGRTELEYSNDSRENLVMSTRLEDTSSGQGQNYTLALGLSHPRSDLDMEMTSHLANSPVAMSAGMDINYMNSRSQSNNMHLRGEIEKLRQQLSMELATPMKTINVEGKAKDDGDMLSVNLVATSDNSEQLSAMFDLDTGRQTLDMSAHYSPDNTENVLQVRGKYLSPTEIKLEATRHHGRRDITEASIDVDLKERHLLHSSLYWRPDMLNDIQDTVQDLMTWGHRGATSTLKTMGNAASRELQARQRYLVENSPDMTPLMQYLQQEADSFQRDYQIVSREANRMYYRNEFFLQDMTNIYRKTVNAISDQLEMLNAVYDVLAHGISQKWAAMVARTELLYQEVSDRINQVVILGQRLQMWVEEQADLVLTRVGKCLQEYAFRLAEWIAPYVEEYIRYYNHATLWMSKTSGQLQDQAQAYYETVKSHPMTQKVNEYYQLTSNQVNSAMKAVRRINPMKNIRDLNLDLDDRVKAVTDKMAERAGELTRTVNRVIAIVHDVLIQKLDEVFSHEKSEYMKQKLALAYNKVKWYYEHYEVERLVKQGVKESLTASVKLVKKNAFYLINDYLHLDDTKIIRYKPKLGILEFQVYLPMEWPTLQTVPMPMAKMRAAYAQVKDLVDMVPDYSVWDTLYAYKPTSNIRDWVPPFTAHAAVIGRQHYVTFDKRYYEFAGECSYVLAGDFINGDFSIIANYDASESTPTRRSISVILEGKEVEISATKVSLDGSDVDLPLELPGGVVRREGSHIVLQSDKGLLVDCDLPRDVCSVRLSGWYFGKTAGLLGTYNNEPGDDLTTADREKTDSVQKFAKSWEVGSCRRHQNQAVVHSARPESPATTECSALFQSRNSPLRPCFKQVDPEPYMRMCVNEAEEDIRGLGVKDAACKMAAVYVAHCRRIEVHIRVPSSCVRCERPGSSPYTQGEDTRLESAPMSADVVFVVQEGECNKDMQRHLETMAVNMELTALNTIGLKETRFGLVGFGGGRQHGATHSHTLNGHLFADARKFKKAVKNLDLDTEGGEGDALSAVHLAASYPFRTGVSKNVILITCGPCSERSVSAEQVQELLQEQGVTLHALTDQDFHLAPELNTPKSNKLFGIDHETAFLANHVSDQKLKGDPVLYGHILPPTDTCSRLAQSTGGSLFNTAKLTQGRVNVQKRFMDIFQRRVAKSAVPAVCQVCKCRADDLGVGSSVCTPCS